MIDAQFETAVLRRDAAKLHGFAPDTGCDVRPVPFSDLRSRLKCDETATFCQLTRTSYYQFSVLQHRNGAA